MALCEVSIVNNTKRHGLYLIGLEFYLRVGGAAINKLQKNLIVPEVRTKVGSLESF